VWRLPALILSATLRGHRRGVWAAQFSPVDKAVVTAAGDKTLRLWSLADASCLRTFEGHTASVLRVSFLTAGTQLLSAGADGLLKLWSVRSSECVSTFDEHEGKVRTWWRHAHDIPDAPCASGHSVVQPTCKDINCEQCGTSTITLAMSRHVMLVFRID